MTKKTKPKKRGRKPGVKVGPYRKRNKATVENTINLAHYSESFINSTKPNILALCGQLETTIDTLTARLTSINARINSLM